MELNSGAWERWVQYRYAIKKPIKDASLEAMKLKLERMGNAEDQAKVVDQSISNQWQGLFPIDEKKPANSPHEPKKRTKEQEAASLAEFERAKGYSDKAWNKSLSSDEIMTKLLLAEALMARYDLEKDDPLAVDRFESLKDQVAGLLRIADPKKVLSNLTTWRLVLRLFSQRGIFRLEDRMKAEA